MSNTGGMLDWYLLAQALGMEWNIWTILTFFGAGIIIFIIITFVVFLLNIWLSS